MPTTPEEKCHVWDETTKELIRQTGCRTYIPWLRQILQKMISETWWWMQSAHLCPVLAVTWFLKSWENEIDVGLSLLFLQKHLLKTHCYLHNSPVADLDRCFPAESLKQSWINRLYSERAEVQEKKIYAILNPDEGARETEVHKHIRRSQMLLSSWILNTDKQHVQLHLKG